MIKNPAFDSWEMVPYQYGDSESIYLLFLQQVFVDAEARYVFWQ